MGRRAKFEAEQKQWKNIRQSQKICRQADSSLDNFIDTLEAVRAYLKVDKKAPGRRTILKSIKTILATKRPIEESGGKVEDGFIFSDDGRLLHSDYKDTLDKEIEVNILAKTQTKGDDLLRKGQAYFQPNENSDIMGKIQKKDKEITKAWRAEDKNEKESAEALEQKLRATLGTLSLTPKEKTIIVKEVIPVSQGKKKKTLKEMAKELRITKQGVKKRRDKAWKKIQSGLKGKINRAVEEAPSSTYDDFINGLGEGGGGRKGAVLPSANAEGKLDSLVNNWEKSS